MTAIATALRAGSRAAAVLGALALGATLSGCADVGGTMSAAVLLSLVEAATITPMRAAFLMKRHGKVSRFEKFLDHFFEGLGHRYHDFLLKIIPWKGTIIIVSTEMTSAQLVPKEFSDDEARA